MIRDQGKLHLGILRMGGPLSLYGEQKGRAAPLPSGPAEVY